MLASHGYGQLPFAEQTAFFRRKLNLPTDGWTDVYAAEHDWAFVVAGANRNDLVSAFRESVEKAIAGGGTLESFRKDFDRIVEQFGWDYNGGRNWRSRVIYETNLFSSYSAGRYEQLMAMRETHPYWQYQHSNAVADPRPEHLAWHGMVLRWDDPWWRYHFPINAWGCQCSVRALSERQLKALGKSGPDTAPPIVWEDKIIGQRSNNGPRVVRVPKGIDPGFEYTPGRSRLESAVPPEREGGIGGSAGARGVPHTVPSATDELPPPRAFPATQLLPAELSPAEYAEGFLREFGATLDTPAIFTDSVGERVVVGRDLFVNQRTGELKADKRERGRFMPLLAQALRDPDEIWVRLEWIGSRQQAVVRRRYIARFSVEGQTEPGIVVFEIDGQGWEGVTAFAGEVTAAQLQAQRVGVRLYRRPK